ncbi:MAG TPA: hypothetical protein VJ824_02380 [Bacillota bacterium]|nr:hypothetical protein [Bacillota bacterium]
MQLATNPVLSQWIKENQSLLRSKPEIMMYIVRHPNGMGHFRPGQPVDHERLSRSAQQFTSQIQQDRRNRKSRKAKPNLSTAKGGDQGERAKERKGLFSGLKNMFPPLGGPLIPASPMKLPVLRPPGVPFARTAVNSSTTVKPKRKSPLRLPKINISRAKLMETMSQTTEMLDVISALMGKLGSMK